MKNGEVVLIDNFVEKIGGQVYFLGFLKILRHCMISIDWILNYLILEIYFFERSGSERKMKKT